MHAAPFSRASFHSRHIRRSRPNSIIFGDGRRPRGAIGDYAGGADRRPVPRRSPALFCRFAVRVPAGRTGTFAIVPPHCWPVATCAHITEPDKQSCTHYITSPYLSVSLSLCVCVPCTVSICGGIRKAARPALKHSSSVIVMTRSGPLTRFDLRHCQLASSAAAGHQSLIILRPLMPSNMCSLYKPISLDTAFLLHVIITSHVCTGQLHLLFYQKAFVVW